LSQREIVAYLRTRLKINKSYNYIYKLPALVNTFSLSFLIKTDGKSVILSENKLVIMENRVYHFSTVKVSRLSRLFDATIK